MYYSSYLIKMCYSYIPIYMQLLKNSGIIVYTNMVLYGWNQASEIFACVTKTNTYSIWFGEQHDQLFIVLVI